MRFSFAAAAAAAAAGLGARVASAGSGQTCALPANDSVKCALPPWPPTWNLTRSSIVYQPWCGNDGDPYLCTGLLNFSAWWADPGRRDKGSYAEAHWGLMSIDDSTSTQMWAGTTYGGATPGDPNTFAAQKAMLDNCNFVRRNGWVDRCFVYDNMVRHAIPPPPTPHPPNLTNPATCACTPSSTHRSFPSAGTSRTAPR